MRKEFNEIKQRVEETSASDRVFTSQVLEIVDKVSEEYYKNSISDSLINNVIKDLINLKKCIPSPMTIYSIDRAIDLIKNITDFQWIIIEEGCRMPNPGDIVDVLIECNGQHYVSIAKRNEENTTWFIPSSTHLKTCKHERQFIAWRYNMLTPNDTEPV